jgi:hypothetical protein
MYDRNFFRPKCDCQLLWYSESLSSRNDLPVSEGSGRRDPLLIHRSHTSRRPADSLSKSRRAVTQRDFGSINFF